MINKVKDLYRDVNNFNSKLSSIRFKFERKCIKNEAKDVRRESIIKLEQEKNLNFNPKKDRSKSIQVINMNLRLKALKEMKEEILLKKSKITSKVNDENVNSFYPVLY